MTPAKLNMSKIIFLSIHNLKEVAEIRVAQQTPALTIRGVEANSLLASAQAGLHVADFLLGPGHRNLSQSHRQVPQRHLVLQRTLSTQISNIIFR